MGVGVLFAGQHAASAGIYKNTSVMAAASAAVKMGFFRKALRSASVSSDSPATFFTLTRANFDRIRSKRPDLAGAFVEFIERILADHIESANREIAALIR